MAPLSVEHRVLGVELGQAWVDDLQAHSGGDLWFAVCIERG